IDPEPNAQLMLVQLLDYLQPRGKTAFKLTLVQANVAIGNRLPAALAKWSRAAVEVTKNHFECASTAWRAYREPTPQGWFNLLDVLARCPSPAVSGLDEGPFTPAMHDDHERFERYKESKLELTPLGQAILARTEDFSRHNPIHRWWGCTELTRDRLWRWDPESRVLIAP